MNDFSYNNLIKLKKNKIYELFPQNFDFYKRCRNDGEDCNENFAVNLAMRFTMKLI